MRKPCGHINERHVPYRTVIGCDCGWVKSIFHRNAMARASMAAAATRQHLKSKQLVSGTFDLKGNRVNAEQWIKDQIEKGN
jgi:hypothetical protein